MKKHLFLLSVIGYLLSVTITKAASTPAPTAYPTSPYTCKYTCTTDTKYTCFHHVNTGTCPRAEVCCDELVKPLPPGSTIEPTPRVTPFVAPGTANLQTRCWLDEWGKEYHPLRPYAASPCASQLIPIKINEAPKNKNYPYLYQSYSCGKAASPGGDVIGPDVVKIFDLSETFPNISTGLLCTDWNNNLDSPNLPENCKYYKQAMESPTHMSYPVLCNNNGNQVCSLGKTVWDVTLDYNDAIVPILGDTKDRQLSDRQKLNNYLSWYLNGAILQAEALPLNTNKVTDSDRIINFSGPVLKLLSKQSLIDFRKVLLQYLDIDVHNYYTSPGTHISGTNPDSNLAGSLGGARASTYFEFASEEDIMSEVQPGIIQTDQPHSPEVDGKVIAAILHIDPGSDSRIFFPHLKNIAALSEYLMSTYKPAPTPKNQNSSNYQCIKNTGYSPQSNPTCFECSDASTQADCSALACCQWVPKSDPSDQQTRQEVTQHFSLLQGTFAYPNGSTYSLGDATSPIYIRWFPDRPMFDFRPVNDIAGNTEVPFEGGLPPAPLFTDYTTRFPTVGNQICDIQDTVTNSGDSLIGGKIYATFTIWQVFMWTPKGFVVMPSQTNTESGGCTYLGLDANSNPECREYNSTGPNGCSSLNGTTCTTGSYGGLGSCCYGECPLVDQCEQAGYECRKNSVCQTPIGLSCQISGGQCCGTPDSTPKPRPPKCPSWPQKDLKTKGRIAIYLKVPFVEKLYQELIQRPDSLLRRFLPYGGPAYQDNLSRASNITPTPAVVCCHGPAAGTCDRITDAASCQAANQAQGCQWDISACPPPTPTPVCCHGPVAGICDTIDNAASCQAANAAQGCTWSCPLTSPAPTSIPLTPAPEFLKTGIEADIGEGGARYDAVPRYEANTRPVASDPLHINVGAYVKNPEMTAGNGGQPALYYPRIGSLFNYLLGAGDDPLNLQCILRPKGYCTASNPVACGQLPDLPQASGSCRLTSYSTDVGSLPKSLVDLVSAAAAAFNTPPNLILGVMYGEGLFNPGRYQWTDINVANWSTCKKIPGCYETGDDHFVGFNGNDFSVISKRADYLAAMKKIDPTRTSFSQCNLMDTLFALSENLNNTAHGGMSFSCFGIPLNSTRPTSCDWNDKQYASAIKVAENGYVVGCLTKENSCLLGGGTGATCDNGTDGCDTINNRYVQRSHFGCVWDVSHGN